jgi:hypothetical protein
MWDMAYMSSAALETLGTKVLPRSQPGDELLKGTGHWKIKDFNGLGLNIFTAPTPAVLQSSWSL